MPKAAVTIEIDDKTRARLERAATMANATVAELAAEAVGQWLDQQEALEAEIEAAEREADKGVFVSSEAVHAWLRRLDEDPDAPFPEPDVFIDPVDRR